MKVVLLNTYETGGAARACYRLFQGLTSASADVGMIVRGGANSPGVISAGSRLGGFLRALLEGLPLHWYPNHQRHNFSSAWVPGRGVSGATRLSPDIVHLHWIPQGFVRIESLKELTCPVIWTLHDSWPFTGGCHLPGECRRYEQACGCCPVLGSSREADWSRRVWQRKMDAWKNIPLTIVCPSRWLAGQAGASSLFANKRIVVIPNGIDTSIYCPGDRSAARRHLGLPESGTILLYGANHAISDRNKGLDLLLESLQLPDAGLLKDAELVIFGEETNASLPGCRVNVRNLGVIDDEERLVQLYRAADLFVAPSRQENLPNMVIEAMACGTPCVAFAVGGVSELIRHCESGYLARPYDIKDLARGIDLILSERKRRQTMADHSREWIVNNMSLVKIVESYQKLYLELYSDEIG